jgi:microcompartment protein CcmK/EutM
VPLEAEVSGADAIITIRADANPPQNCEIANGIVDAGHGEFLVSDFVSGGWSRRKAEAADGGSKPPAVLGVTVDWSTRRQGCSSCQPRDF